MHQIVQTLHISDQLLFFSRRRHVPARHPSISLHGSSPLRGERGPTASNTFGAFQSHRPCAEQLSFAPTTPVSDPEEIRLAQSPILKWMYSPFHLMTARHLPFAHLALLSAV